MGDSRKLSEENREIFNRIYKEVKDSSRFMECENYISHGTTTLRQHVVAVTLLALNISEKLHLDIDKEALIRGALLHDYYLYDWHEKKLKELHGFHHPVKALKEALKDFKLTEKEKDIIRHHMYPLTFNTPKSREAWLICISDKICAWGETLEGKIKNISK